MTNEELKKLRRQDLLEILLEQSQEIERLKNKLNTAEEELKNRKLQFDDAGSIAEAAIRISGVFEAAQSAAEQYLENVKDMNSKQEAVCAERDEESRRMVENRLAETEKKCQQMEEEMRSKCSQMMSDTQDKIQKQWDVFRNKLTMFSQCYENMKEWIPMINETLKEGGHLD